MRKIAIFNIESFASHSALRMILKKHQDQIKLVVLSRPIKAQKKPFVQQVYNHWKNAGSSYVQYLTLNFLAHPYLATVSGWAGKIFNGSKNSGSIAQLCSELGIDYIYTDNVNSREVVEHLKKSDIDLITVYYFDQILKGDILSFPKHGIINFHAAMLPHCKGLHPIIWSALENKPFGLSAHLIVDEKIDAGPVIGQIELQNTQTTHILDLEQQVNEAGVKLYSKVIRDWPRQNKLSPQVNGSYFSHPKVKDLNKLKQQGYSLTNVKKWFKSYFTQSQSKYQKPLKSTAAL